ncbi:MAG TPA: hypothetical protein VGM90_37005 [Kofleriaceae bacterium]
MKAVLGVISTLFIIASPFVLYWTLTHRDVTVASLTLLAWVALRAIPIVLTAKKEQRRAALQLPAIGLVFALLGLVSKNGVWLLVLPSATQATFGLTFLRSLRGTPLIEHFARMMDPDLGVPQQAHCRRWTKYWAYYLFALAALGLVVAATCSLAVWTLYAGVISYGMVGVLFAFEYVVRKLEFRDYNRKNPIDFVLSLLAPPRPVPAVDAKDVAP